MSNAEYYIAQYLREPFRREPRNVGVIVVRDGIAAARFLGESDAGVIDGKKIRSFPHPDIYRHWVDAWREELSDPSDVPIATRLLEQNGGNYNVVVGGRVSDAGDDSAQTIVNHLFGMLVRNESLMAPQVEEVADGSTRQLNHQITTEFKNRGLLENSGAKNPIRTSAQIAGKATVHTPAYHQQNGVLWVMELVNFAQQDKSRARDHAGWAAKMFDDIIAKRKRQKIKAKAVAIVEGSPIELGEEIAKRTLPLLKTSARLVFRENRDSWEQFLEERQQIATGKAG